METKKVVGIIICTILFLWFIVVNIQRAIDKNEVLKSHGVTCGWVVSCHETGEHSNQTMEYNYRLNGKLYSRTIAPSTGFNECEKNFNSYAKKEFLVIFSKSDFSKSLINLHQEVGDSDKLIPENLEDFE